MTIPLWVLAEVQGRAPGDDELKGILQLPVQDGMQMLWGFSSSHLSLGFNPSPLPVLPRFTWKLSGKTNSLFEKSKGSDTARTENSHLSTPSARIGMGNTGNKVNFPTFHCQSAAKTQRGEFFSSRLAAIIGITNVQGGETLLISVR